MQATTFTLIVLSVYAAYYAALLLYDRMTAKGAVSLPTDARVYSFSPQGLGHEVQVHRSDSSAGSSTHMEDPVNESSDTGLVELADDVIPDDGIEVTEGNLSDYFKRNGRF
jgi:hypothetical protein